MRLRRADSGAAGFFLQELDRACPRPWASSASSSASGISGSLSAGACEAEHRLGRHAWRCGRAGPRRRGRSVRCPRARKERRRASAGPPPGDFHAQALQGFEQVQDGAVVDRQRLGRRAAPVAARGAAFEEGEAVGIEQRAAVGRHAAGLGAGCRRARPGRWRAGGPGIDAAFQHFFAVLVGHFLQLLPQGGDGVVLVVERLAEKQQAALLGGEEEHQPHHDGEGGFVELRLGLTPASRLRLLVLVERVEGLDQHLDGLAHLVAELVGDFLLIAGAFLEQRQQRVVVGDAEEAAHTEQGMEGPQGDRLLQPEGGIPGGVAGGLAARGIDQHPLLAVGDQAQRHVGAVEQLHHAGGGGGLPVLADDGPVELLLCRVAGDQQLRLAGGIAARRANEGKVGAQGFAHFGHAGFQPRGKGLPSAIWSGG